MVLLLIAIVVVSLALGAVVASILKDVRMARSPEAQAEQDMRTAFERVNAAFGGAAEQMTDQNKRHGSGW